MWASDPPRVQMPFAYDHWSCCCVAFALQASSVILPWEPLLVTMLTMLSYGWSGSQHSEAQGCDSPSSGKKLAQLFFLVRRHFQPLAEAACVCSCGQAALKVLQVLLGDVSMDGASASICYYHQLLWFASGWHCKACQWAGSIFSAVEGFVPQSGIPSIPSSTQSSYVAGVECIISTSDTVCWVQSWVRGAFCGL